MKKLKKIFALALALCLAFSLASCGSGGSSVGGEQSGGGTQAEDGSGGSSGNEESGGANHDADGNGRVDKVVYAGSISYTSLIPFLNAKVFTTAVYESLGAMGEYGDVESFDGLLMESWEYDGDKTYTVHLYDNITDSKGNHITADDVVFCYETVRTTGEISKTSVIGEINRIDDLTVEFVWLDTPVAGAFESILSVVNIVSQEEYEKSGDGMASSPVGTGPYVLEDWTSGVSMTLKVNENYWASGDQVKFDRQKQNVDEIEIQTITETSQLTMALQTDKIDMTGEITSQDAGNFQEGGAYASNHAVEEMEAFAPKTLLVNVSDSSPMSDENLRLAVAHAINVDQIVMLVNGGSNHAIYGVGSPYNSDYDEEAFRSYIPAYDVDLAKEYLAKSNYPDGTAITLLLIDGGVSNDVAEIIQNQLSQIGVDVNVDAQIFPNWLSNKGDPAKWDIIVSELSSSDFVTSIWQNAFDTSDGEANEIFSDDPQLQTLLEACSRPDNHTQESVNAFQQYISEHVYAIPTIATLNYNVYNTDLISEIAYSGEGTVIPQAFEFK